MLYNGYTPLLLKESKCLFVKKYANLELFEMFSKYLPYICIKFQRNTSKICYCIQIQKLI